jgi:hypothetical protein
VTLPAMVLLGPLMVLQYVYWTRRRGGERTTWQYQQAEPGVRRGASSTLPMVHADAAGPGSPTRARS